MRKAIFVFVVVLISSCNTTKTSPDEQETLDTQSIPSQDSIWTLDSKFSEISRQVPGFGGAFYDEEGNINIYMTDISSKEETVNSLVEMFGEEVFTKTNLRSNSESLILGRDVKVLQGDYDFKTLAEWRRELDDVMVAHPDVIFTDIDEATNRILIGVTSEHSVEQIQASANTLRIPLDAIDFEIGQVESTSLALNDRVRPLVGGLEIVFSRGGICTLGFNAYSYSASAYGFVSNSHCSSADFALDNRPVFQGNQQVGREVIDPAPFTGGACPSGRQCRYSDSNFIEYDFGVNHESSYAYTTQRAGVSVFTRDIHRFESIDSAIVGLPQSSWVGISLHKVGAASGDTEGTVSNSCANFYNVEGTSTSLLCQTRVRARIEGGDSGAPVLRELPHNHDILYGLAWGDYTRFTITGLRRYFIFSSYEGVERDLGFLNTTY